MWGERIQGRWQGKLWVAVASDQANLYMVPRVGS